MYFDGNIDRRSPGIISQKIRLNGFGFIIQFSNWVAAFCQMTKHLVESDTFYSNGINILIDILGEKISTNTD